MAKQDVNPDALASKAFIVTMMGAILYITVVFVFVIFGNRRDEEARQQQPTEPAGSISWGTHHD
jgi:hypothetical protein